MSEQKQDLRKGRDRSFDQSRSKRFTELGVSKLRLGMRRTKQKDGTVTSKPETEATYRDRKQGGLLLRINKSGAKMWRVQYYDPHQRKMRTDKLGEFQPGNPIHMSVKDARKATKYHHGNLEKILDERKKMAVANRDSFKAVSDWYVEKFVEGQRRSAPQIKAVIKAILPTWENKPFEAITRPDVVELLDKIAETRGPRAADVTLAVLRRMMNKHAVRSKTGYSSVIVEGMAQIEDPRERARDRILDDREIRLMFAACDRLGTFGAMCKVLLYTAQRRTKVATMQFDDILDGVWTIPMEKREKGNAQRLKLPKPVLDIIEAQAELKINDYVFPASRVGRRDGPGEHFGSYSAFGQGKADLDKAMADIAPKPVVPHWTLHDIRRTSRSLMSRAGIRPDIAERVLGHVIGGVEGVYDRHDYDAERETALLSLASLIETIIRPPAKGGNVVSINRR
ncbi:integrase arm-type DNA-binding domain-containing protein [Bradyrhizobium lablabi]|uniref:tyrosine-type recombinase/integrase n=1 Tax=Bradyrhizobium lablabi TaxID=722472 RepID=UPI001BA4ECE9|nr:integrase arm-type DNA-binding domain-containing protein [Bradyrhizobium lablabi]MBR1120862.1 integrase arm-type DNA-binding domain-containing protein [Bradyrhizobium lablabi]